MDAATSPAGVQISIKRLDPVATGFLARDAGLSFLADIEMRSASDGHILTTKGTMHIQNLKLREGGAAAPEPLDFGYSGTHLLKENTGQIKDAMTRIGDAAIHVSGTYRPVAIGTDELELNLKLTGQSLPIDELQHLMTVAGVRLPNGAVLKGGMLALNLAIIGPAKSLVISGPIALDNTRLVGFDIGSKIHTTPMPPIGFGAPSGPVPRHDPCSAGESPPPPYSVGQVGVPQPFSPIRLRHSSASALGVAAASGSAGALASTRSEAGKLASIQPRTSARNGSSSAPK